ncbi:DUF4279 domain-containing protein [Phyllobacterium sp. 628]|uniref:DUF4279 domain-containing protein n=1 Tax=Phyllobacterium sp. 628 TaxID=2718938 RepID=UPI00166240FF|nr:DUF4279 domain-containing protein [Phyllobacterium sp. 628]QND53197.1 DUF4279 domain-containing protein [Phyllobacterium sp. 628]
MAEISKTAASLSIQGEYLDHDIITQKLGVFPSSWKRKGEPWFTPNGQKMIARFGMWTRSVPRRDPGDLDAQIAEILKPLSTDLTVWKDITSQFKAYIFCGLFMEEGNEGINVAPKTLVALGSRGLSLEFDIYSPPNDVNDE